MSSETHRDSLIQRATESLRKSERAERLGVVLEEVARELADARRQTAALQRENADLRAQLAEHRRAGREPATPVESLPAGVWDR